MTTNKFRNYPTSGMTPNETFRKAIRSNFDLMVIAKEALLRNLETAGLDFGNVTGADFQFRLSPTGVIVSGNHANQNSKKVVSEKEYTWEELDKRVNFREFPRAMKLKEKKRKVFHPIRNVSNDGIPVTYCGEGWKASLYNINLVKQYVVDGNTECKNCQHTKARG